MSVDEPRDPFAEMLGRATVDPPADLVDRMRAETAAHGAVDAGERHRRGFPRLGTAALVAACVLLVVGMAVFSASREDGPVAEPAAQDGNLLPTWWPDGFDGAVTTGEAAGQRMVGYREYLLADRGIAMALASVIDGQRAESTSATTPDDGVQWTGRIDLDGASLQAVGRDVSGEERHRALLLDLLGTDGRLSDAVLPQGWTVIDDPDGVMTATFTGRSRPGTPTSTAIRSGSGDDGPDGHIAVMSIRTDDAALRSEAVRSFAGPDQVPVEVAPGRWGTIVDQVSTTDRSVVWSPDPGMVVVVSGSGGVTDDDLLLVASSARPVDAATWSKMYTPSGRELSEDSCRAFDARPSGLGPVSDRNGVTQLGGSWIQVLSEDLFRLTTGDRRRVAEAVIADTEGYERVVRDLTVAERRAFDTMRRVATDPDRIDEFAADEDVRLAAFHVTMIGRSGCGFA